MIKLEGVHKAFNGRPVLRGVDLVIPRGTTVCIIGGSGTGKSVTVKHMVGLLKADQGRVYVDDEDITDATGAQLIAVRRKFGVLFQSAALLKWLSVFDNVALPLRELSRMGRSEVEERVMAKLKILGVADARAKFPNEISGGMQKRVGLARALIWDPPYVIYDEPTSGLDPVITRRVDEMILEAREKFGVTSTVVTHDMASAYRIADQIAMLYDGKVIQVGTPQEIQETTDPVVRQFIEGRLDGPITQKIDEEEHR